MTATEIFEIAADAKLVDIEEHPRYEDRVVLHFSNSEDRQAAANAVSDAGARIGWYSETAFYAITETA